MMQPTLMIQRLTSETLYAVAREKAEQHIPHDEANHFEPGTLLWHDFNIAYSQAVFAAECEGA